MVSVLYYINNIICSYIVFTMGLSDVIGPSYSYSELIKSPRELNMGPSSEDLENNVT